MIASGRYAVWSITWKDVEDFEQSPNQVSAPLLFDGLGHGRLRRVGTELGLSLDPALGQRGSMEMLLGYLKRPDVSQWETLAQAYALTWLTSVSQWLSPKTGAELESRLESEGSHFRPGPMAQVGRDAPVLTRHHCPDWFAAIGRSSRKALEQGKVDRMVLRLFDEKAERESPVFEASWRAFLHAWNVLQFHDVSVVSSERIHSGYTMVPSEDLAAETPDAGSTGSGLDPALAELLDLATGESKPLIECVSEAGLPWPSLDYELPGSGNLCGPAADLAWPPLRLAVLAASQLEDQPAFEQHGWMVLRHPVAQDELIRVLKARESSQEAPNA